NAVGIMDLQYNHSLEMYFYPCTCRDNFFGHLILTKEELENGENVATCPGCSLIIKVIDDKGHYRPLLQGYQFCGLLFC
uniref:Diphthamide biosynthesis protein 3 n=1 Tax=Equus asinus TaxID=9793 RepID=A0A8C4LZQ2_EQUAS